LRCALQLPVIIWAVSSYAIARHIFDLGVMASLAAGAGIGYLVFVVERMIIATPKNAWMLFARLVLTLVMSLLGASALDIVLFKKDIEVRLRASAATAYLTKRQLEITAQETDVNNKRSAWQDALTVANNEAACRGSPRCGVGPITRQLLAQAERKRTDYEEAERALSTLRAEIEQGSNSAGEAAPLNAGVLQRVTGLSDFIRDNPPALAFWIAFLILIVMLEASVLIAKYAGGEALDERVHRLREERLLTMLERHASVTTGRDLPRLGRA
ncbi:MAG: DUF4407 domain-containing protein, partial [Tagaea sp.]